MPRGTRNGVAAGGRRQLPDGVAARRSGHGPVAPAQDPTRPAQRGELDDAPEHGDAQYRCRSRGDAPRRQAQGGLAMQDHGSRTSGVVMARTTVSDHCDRTIATHAVGGCVANMRAAGAIFVMEDGIAAACTAKPP